MRRFGPFEVDFSTSELRKSGSRVRIQEQTLRLLEILLEQPGDLVTREQVRERLWPSYTFVDFERSLNAAVAKLRQALHDSAGLCRDRCAEGLPVHRACDSGGGTDSCGATAGGSKPAASCASRRYGGRVRRRSHLCLGEVQSSAGRKRQRICAFHSRDAGRNTNGRCALRSEHGGLAGWADASACGFRHQALPHPFGSTRLLPRRRGV